MEVLRFENKINFSVVMEVFKGLGEINSDHLQDTTFTSERRSLLQVGVAEVDEAEGIFSTLMGDIVEPPRLYIQAHALNLVNLDEQGVNIISVEHCSYG